MEHPNIFSDGCPQSTEKPKMNNGKVGITSSLYFFSTHEKACEACNWNSTPCHWFQSILKVTQDGITSGWKQKYDLRRPKKNMTFRTPRSMLESVKHFSKLLNVLKSKQHNTEAEVLNHSLAKYLPTKDGVDWCTHHRWTTTLNPQKSKTRFLLIATGLLSRHQRVLQLSPTANEDLGSDGGCGQWLPSTGVMICETKKRAVYSSFILKHLKLEMPRTEIYHPCPFGLWPLKVLFHQI